eukprot:30544-Eustigmatos_ZCMA.PRE.1
MSRAASIRPRTLKITSNAVRSSVRQLPHTLRLTLRYCCFIALLRRFVLYPVDAQHIWYFVIRTVPSRGHHWHSHFLFRMYGSLLSVSASHSPFATRRATSISNACSLPVHQSI